MARAAALEDEGSEDSDDGYNVMYDSLPRLPASPTAEDKRAAEEAVQRALDARMAKLDAVGSTAEKEITLARTTRRKSIDLNVRRGEELVSRENPNKNSAAEGGTTSSVVTVEDEDEKTSQSMSFSAHDRKKRQEKRLRSGDNSIKEMEVGDKREKVKSSSPPACSAHDRSKLREKIVTDVSIADEVNGSGKAAAPKVTFANENEDGVTVRGVLGKPVVKVQRGSFEHAYDLGARQGGRPLARSRAKSQEPAPLLHAAQEQETADHESAPQSGAEIVHEILTGKPYEFSGQGTTEMILPSGHKIYRVKRG